MNINTSNTADKFLPMVDIIMPMVVETLKALCELEEKYFSLKKKQRDLFSDESWGEYQEEYRAIIEPVCTDKLIKRGYANSLGSPATYEYIKKGNCEIDFTMKSEKKAIVEIYFKTAIQEKHQLTLVSTQEGYKIDIFKYAYGDETTWNNYHI